MIIEIVENNESTTNSYIKSVILATIKNIFWRLLKTKKNAHKIKIPKTVLSPYCQIGKIVGWQDEIIGKFTSYQFGQLDFLLCIYI